MLMRVSANLPLEKLPLEPTPQEAVAVGRSRVVSVTQWAADPEVRTRTLQELLGQVSRDIADALPASPPEQAR
jgi:hypothetical protein